MYNKNVAREIYFSKNIFFLILMILVPPLELILLRESLNVSILLLLLIGLSFYIGYVYYQQNKKFESTYDWIPIHAKVIQKRVFHLNCMSINSGMDKYHTRTHGYKVDITYKYKYNNNEYKSNQYALSFKSDADCNYLYTLDEAKKIMYRSTKDNNIKVYVNPDNPAESVIKQGKSIWYGMPYIFYLSIYISVLVFFIYWIA